MKRFVFAVSASLAALSISAQAQQMPTVEAERTAAFGSAPEFTMTDPVTRYSYDSGYLGSYVDAPLQSVQAILVPMTPAEAFPLIHSGNAQWSLQIEELTWDHSNSKTPGSLGVGSVRRCDFVGGAGIAYERILAFEADRMIAYDLDVEKSTVPLPIKDFFVVWTLEDKGADGTLVIARIHYDEAQDTGGQAAMAVAGALAVDFRNFANLYGGTYVEM
ncbi:MAG: SRPBCC family protein [Pseudomonadota bacterium]